MRAVVQRVRRARVTVEDNRVTGAIGPGLCVLVSVGPGDTEAIADHLAARVAGLRIMSDEAGHMNIDVTRSGGAVLVVSQFTLHADTSRGHRPSFIRAAPPQQARALYERFAKALRGLGLVVATGEFGAMMRVEIENDGPVTLVLSSGEPDWAADAG